MKTKTKLESKEEMHRYFLPGIDDNDEVAHATFSYEECVKHIESALKVFADFHRTKCMGYDQDIVETFPKFVDQEARKLMRIFNLKAELNALEGGII